MNSARPSVPKDEEYETFQKEENMRNDLTATDGGTCQKHHLAGRKRRAAECDSQKTYYGAKRCRNAFLRYTFPCIKSEISMHGVTTTGEEINYITQENYEFLRDSYFRYAALMGEPAPHNPGRSPGEGISNLYYEMVELLDSELGVNFEYSRDKISFTLWKHHRWDTDILCWLPVKFVEALPEELHVSPLHSCMTFGRSITFLQPTTPMTSTTSSICRRNSQEIIPMLRKAKRV